MPSDDFKKAALEASFRSGEAALRAAITINAGGVAALLAFLGSGRINTAGLVAWFAIGMLVGAAGTVFAYAANYGTFRWSTYDEPQWAKASAWCGWTAFWCAVISDLLFAGGMIHAWLRFG